MLFTTETLTRLWQHVLLVVDKRVEKVEGKGLSTNDYTNEDKQKLSNIPGDIQSQLNTKASTSDLSNKVDVVDGKGLSTNDYTTAEKQKLANIPADTQSQLNNKVDLSNFATANVPISSETSTISIPSAITSTERMLVFHNGLLLAKDIHYSVGGGSISLIDYTAHDGDIIIFMTI